MKNDNTKDYVVDISAFERERPNGVSGLMRVKNEARWVAASIDSCIGALDELIICYQDCDDQTPDIIHRKQQEYPDKIKVYYYAPEVFAFDLSEDDFNYACGLPDNSIHLLSNYYNYTLSKATYRYALKIDADQIYFTERLQQLCDAYRSSEVRVARWSEKVSYCYYRVLCSLFFRFPEIGKIATCLIHSRNGQIYKKYVSYLTAQISRTKQPVALSGINLHKKDDDWWVCRLEEGETFSSLYFNGVGDLVIFRVSDKTYYVPSYQSPVPVNDSKKIVYYNPVYKKHRIIESFVYPPCQVHFIGFMWYHMKFCTMKQIESKTIQPVMRFTSFMAASYRMLNAQNRWTYRDGKWVFFHGVDKSIPSPETLVVENE